MNRCRKKEHHFIDFSFWKSLWAIWVDVLLHPLNKHDVKNCCQAKLTVTCHYNRLYIKLAKEQHVLLIYLWANLWNYTWNEENVPEPSILTDSCELTNRICLSALAVHRRTPLRIWRWTDHKHDTVLPLSGFYYMMHGKGAREGLFKSSDVH